MQPPEPHPQDRYSRQILFPGIGLAGQKLLAEAHVAVVGVGATGAATASMLARGGVGELTLIDRDFVEYSNLQRQILFDEADAVAALPKAEAARRKIASFNASVEVQAEITDLIPANIHALLAPAHLILDCTDNFETRYLLNDYAVRECKPWIYAAAIGGYAATMNVLPTLTGQEGLTPHSSKRWVPTSCLACIFPTRPSGQIETCDVAGILSTAVNLAASVQTTEAFKFLTGQFHLMRRTLLSHDLWTNQRTEVKAAHPAVGCRVCGDRIFDHLSGASRPHVTLCGRNSVQIHEHHRPLDLASLERVLCLQPDLTEVRANTMLLRFRRGPYTLSVFPDGRALIQGTTDVVLARSLYARYIGL